MHEKTAIEQTKTVWVLNGPNLNLLGERERDVYGAVDLPTLERQCREVGQTLSLAVLCRQTNHEGTLVTWVQEARREAKGLVINPGAYGHTSIALLDAVRAVCLPTVEVHLSNIHRRESFRARTFLSRGVDGVICGLGALGYTLALHALAGMLATHAEGNCNV